MFLMELKIALVAEDAESGREKTTNRGGRNGLSKRRTAVFST